ncbi:MAG: FG-GAP-like repeat-containing protein [Terriglobales bacterium]
MTHTAPGASASVAVPPVFFRRVTYDSGGQNAWSIAVADVNGDGKPDMVVVDYGSRVGVLLGKGNGSFQPVVSYYSGGGGATSIAVGDLNKDGKLDLVVVNQGCPAINCLGVLLGNGDGTFQPVVIYDRGGTGGGIPGMGVPIFIADVSGDGKPDLVVANATGTNGVDGVVGVLIGNGDGTFQPVVPYDAGGYGTSSAVAADVNGDGKLDVVVANCGGSVFYCPPTTTTVGVLLGNGNGTFQAVKTYSREAWGSLADPLVVADVNGDGKVDIVVGNQCPQENGNCVGDASIEVLLGNGDGTFRGATTYDSGGNATFSVTVADLNGDGKPDLAVANNYGTGVLLGNGDGTFQPAETYAGGGCCQVLVADVNLDGRPDLLGVGSTSQTVSVLLGTGDGTFEAAQTLGLGGSEFSWLAVADVNKDGRPDLLAANWCAKPCQGQEGTVSVLLNIRPTTKTVLSTSGSPSHFGQPVTFTATVTSNHGPIPDGELVKFYDGTKFLASAPLTGGVTAYTTSTLSVATHTIKARYMGDAFFKPSTGKVSQVVVP